MKSMMNSVKNYSNNFFAYYFNRSTCHAYNSEASTRISVVWYHHISLIWFLGVKVSMISFLLEIYHAFCFV